MRADFMAPREGDVCLRVDKGDGVAGSCTLNHPTYGRIRLPLTTDPAAPPRGQTRVASVAPKDIGLRLCLGSVLPMCIQGR